MIGQTIAHYKVIAKLGAGGMGEVYRATDTKLGRDVALKVLPEAFAQDTQRMQRFQREAQVLASLNHPHIAAIYGLEHQDQVQALAMELVDGPTLAERIAQGALPVEETLANARQIAEALEYAHEKGIIHRDLKPANIKVTPEGQVKVLDFGLAKALSDDSAARDISNSPTLTAAATRAGIVLGTAAYMSPEQAKGKSVDRRADIWAFGVVLFEMLTGGQMYSGETAAETMAAVIKDEPAWDKLPANTPPHLREVLRRCLTRDSRHRLQSIGDARIAIEETIADPHASVHASQADALRVVAAPAWRRALPWALAGLLAVALGASLWRSGEAERSLAKVVSRFAIAIPDNETLTMATSPAVAISPDGSKLVYAARLEGTVKLFLRPVDRLEATPIPGTENASAPFFSPDGNWLAFFADGKLKKAPLNGGPVVAMADVVDHRGGAWAGDTIVFSPNALGGIYRIPAGGGTPQPVTQLDESRKERTHRFPRFLPDGRTVLFTVGTQQSPDYYDNARIDAVDLETGQRQTVFEGASTAAYLSSGYLVVARAASLFAVPFDMQRRVATGSETTVLQGVAGDVTTGAVHFAVSNNGTLFYVPGTQTTGVILTRMDRTGKVEPLPAPRRTYLELSLSPEGRRVAVTIGTINEYDIWVYDLARGTLSRLTFGGVNRSPKWSGDGRHVIYANVAQSGQSAFYSKAADGSGSATLIRQFSLAAGARVFVDDLSTDGKTISAVGGVSSDVFMVPATGASEARPFASDPRFDEFGSAFSPDSRWVAYASTESGRPEIYVRALAESGGKWQVSTSGGESPHWSRNGKELFYHVGNRMMAVPVQTAPGFQAGTPQPLFDNYFDLRTDAGSVYDVSPDGKWFIAVRPANEQALARQLHVVLNWSEEVQRAAPGAK